MNIDEAWGNNELAVKANGGTELMRRWLWNNLSESERESVQIVTSRVRDLSEDRPSILWLHDLAQDPENERLRDPAFRSMFAKLVFVSRWQFEQYRLMYGITYDESAIITNVCRPFQYVEREPGPVRLIYHTTPHRGLELLVPIVQHLAEEKGHLLHLDVYSSFEAYGWPERDEPYRELFDIIRSKSYMTYHGYQPNDVVREALTKAHIFCYPSIWQETSCIAAMEALAAGCAVVCPDYGALVETVQPFGVIYRWSEDTDRHASVCAAYTAQMIRDAHTEQFTGLMRQQVVGAGNKFSPDAGLRRWKRLIQEVTE